MARLLVQLKLRLLVNALRVVHARPRSLSSSARCSPVLVAVGTFIVLALLRGRARRWT